MAEVGSIDVPVRLVIACQPDLGLHAWPDEDPFGFCRCGLINTEGRSGQAPILVAFERVIAKPLSEFGEIPRAEPMEDFYWTEGRGFFITPEGWPDLRVRLERGQPLFGERT
jgi:hypothetical protein